MSPRVGLDINRIAEAATDIANKEGFHFVTLASVAKQLNVRPPSLYNHVDGLQAIRKKLTLLGLEQLYQAMKKELDQNTKGETIHQVGIAYVTYARNNPGLYEATLSAPNPNDFEIQEAGEKIVTLALQLLEPFQLNKEDAIHAIRGWRSILHGFCSLEQMGGFGMDLSVDESFFFTLDAYLTGIKNYG